MAIRDNTKFKSMYVAKEKFTETLIRLMTEAGWEDISSLPSKDGAVMYSPGEDGNQKIHVQISDSYSIGSTSYMMASTTTRYGGIRLLTDYTPGASGKQGTVLPAADSMISYVIYPRAIGGNIETKLYYNINKDRVVIINEDSFTQEGMWMYFGKPRPNYSKAYANQNLVVTGHSTRYIGKVAVLGLADTTIRTQSLGVLMTHNTGKATNAKGELMLSEIGVGHNESGFIGYVDGLYTINKSFIESNNTGIRKVICGDRTLKILKCAVGVTGTSWTNTVTEIPVIAFEVEEGYE